MDELYNGIFERLDVAITQINVVKSKVAKRDLIKMVRAIDKKLTEMDQELIECRRRQKKTSRFNDLQTQATELIENLEKHITFASLIG